MSDFNHLRWERRGRLAVVTMDRPPVNAVHTEMYKELRALFGDVGELGADLRAIVLQGAGRHFCAGNDLDEFASMTPANAPERMFHVREAFTAIYRSELPVVAAVQGAALGTGLAIAASCDVIVASDDARMGLPEVRVGVMGGARHLSRLMPPSMVRYLHYTGEPFPASAFVPFGSVLRVVPRELLLDTALDVARSFARHSPIVLAYAKRSLNEIEHMDVQRGYEYEQSLTCELVGHPHAREALRSVMEDRAPEYDPPTKSKEVHSDPG